MKVDLVTASTGLLLYRMPTEPCPYYCARQVLAMPLLHSRAAATLSSLHNRGLLEYCARRDKYCLHPVVKAAVEGIAADVGFSCDAARCEATSASCLESDYFIY